MTVHGSLVAVSAWLTYLVQIAFAYLVFRSLGALIQRSAVRVQLWRCFIVSTVIAWLVLFAPFLMGGSNRFFILSVKQGSSALSWSLPLTAASISNLNSLATWAMRLYLLMLALSLFQMLLRGFRLASLVRCGQNPSPELNLLFQGLCKEMKIGRCTLSLNRKLRSPGTASWYHPQVFLPAEIIPRLTSREITDILRHELSHIRGRDYLWDRIAALACRVVFIHPAVWLGYRRLRWETELACDQEVVADQLANRFLYAECLTRLARWQNMVESRSPEGVSFASSASLLATRVRALLVEPSSPSLFQQTCTGGLVAAITLLAVVVLPSVGLTFYQSMPHLPPDLSFKAGARLPHHMRLAKKLSGMQAQTQSERVPAEVQGKTAGPNQLPTVFADLNALPMPVLATSASPEARDVGARSGSTMDRNNRPIWDESRLPTDPSSPGWGDVASTAIRVGVSLAQSQTESTGRSDGERPGHFQ